MIFSIAVPALIVIAIIAILCTGYLKAPPDVAYVISGVRKKPRILVGRAGVKIPFFERVDKLALGAVQIDVKTSSSVPTAEYINVKVDSNVNVRVGQSPEMIELACQNFLNVPREEINKKVRDLLEGNVREIIGQMRLTDMVSDRKAFSEKVQENAVPDLARFGLELISFNVQNFVDDNNVIDNLGIDNVEQIRKKAAIAKSDAQREIAIAEAANVKAANDAKAKAKMEIAEKNAEVEVRESELKKTTDTEKAIADAAYEIQQNEQAKAIKVSQTNAEIAQREREVELRQKEIELKERELDATVRKEAEAAKYAAQQRAEADLICRQREADAKAYEIKMQAEAQKVKAEADRYAAEQQAAGIAAVGTADAQAIEAKAEAQKKMGEASVVEMYLNALPAIVANAAAPLTNVDKITMYGEGNSSAMVGDIMKSTDQVINALNEATGLNIKDVITSFMGAKAAQ